MQTGDKYDIERLRAFLNYDPDSGVFTWKPRTPEMCPKRKGAAANFNARFGGAVAGHYNSQGYMVIAIMGVRYQATHVAWALTHGVWPKDFVDHINAVRDDNRICNLREATPSQNQHNRSRCRSNTSGFKGVWFHRGAGKFAAGITLNGKAIHLGLHATAQEAHEAYCRAAKELHGAFAKVA